MLRFFLKELCGRPHLLGTSVSFLVTLLGGWFLLKPPESDPVLSHIFFWTVLVFCLQNAVQSVMGQDQADGTLKSVCVSPLHPGFFLFTRYASFLCFGALLFVVGFLVQSFFAGFFSLSQAGIWLVALPSVLCILFFSSTLSVLTRASFLLGTFLAYPLVIPVFILTFLAEKEGVALMALVGCGLLLVPLTLLGALCAVRVEQQT